MRAEVAGVSFGRGGVPTKLHLKIGDQEVDLSLSAVWRALSSCSVESIDPLKISPKGIRVAIIDRDGRPNFAVAKKQIHGTIFIRTDEGKGDSFLPHEISNKVFRPSHLPLLVGRWVLSIKDKLNPRLPRIPSMD